MFRRIKECGRIDRSTRRVKFHGSARDSDRSAGCQRALSATCSASTVRRLDRALSYPPRLRWQGTRVAKRGVESRIEGWCVRQSNRSGGGLRNTEKRRVQPTASIRLIGQVAKMTFGKLCSVASEESPRAGSAPSSGRGASSCRTARCRPHGGNETAASGPCCTGCQLRERPPSAHPSRLGSYRSNNNRPGQTRCIPCWPDRFTGYGIGRVAGRARVPAWRGSTEGDRPYM